MSWNEFKSNPYKWLWKRVGSRPWTFIWRDIYHEAEWLIQLIWFFTGVGVFYLAQGVCLEPWWGILAFWVVYTIGYINGHFHWGTQWIKGQRGNNS